MIDQATSKDISWHHIHVANSTAKEEQLSRTDSVICCAAREISSDADGARHPTLNVVHRSDKDVPQCDTVTHVVANTRHPQGSTRDDHKIGAPIWTRCLRQSHR
jgi:hypothetical protein